MQFCAVCTHACSCPWRWHAARGRVPTAKRNATWACGFVCNTQAEFLSSLLAGSGIRLLVQPREPGCSLLEQCGPARRRAMPQQKLSSYAVATSSTRARCTRLSVHGSRIGHQGNRLRQVHLCGVGCTDVRACICLGSMYPCPSHTRTTAQPLAHLQLHPRSASGQAVAAAAGVAPMQTHLG